MQTFLPYPDFLQSAQCLDRQRLGKQRVEAIQIIYALLGVSGSNSWKNHPAVRMWAGHEGILLNYALHICRAWKNRGYKDTVEDKVISIQHLISQSAYHFPDWINDEFCRSHQSNLVRKNPEYYRKYFPDVPDNLPYIWPVS